MLFLHSVLVFTFADFILIIKDPTFNGGQIVGVQACLDLWGYSGMDCRRGGHTNVCLIICDEYAQFYDLLRLLFWQPKSRGKKRK